jgi:hypothetical protein
LDDLHRSFDRISRALKLGIAPPGLDHQLEGIA